MEGEVVEFFVPRHWIVLVPLMAVFLLLVIALIVVNSLWYILAPPVSAEWLILFNGTYLAFILHFFFFRAINSLMNIMIVTNFRVLRVRSTVFLLRERNVISMKNVQDIEMNQSGILPRLLNYGEIVITSASGEYELSFHYIPHTQKIYNILNHIYQKESQSQQFQSTKK